MGSALLESKGRPSEPKACEIEPPRELHDQEQRQHRTNRDREPRVAFPKERQREQHQIDQLRKAHLDQGDVEAAATAALRALRLSASVTSARSHDRIAHLDRALAAFRGVPAVDDFHDQAKPVLDAAQASG